MKSLILYAILLGAIPSLFAKPLIFAPTPLASTQRVLEDFSPMVHYLEKALGERIEFRHEKQYDDIIELFANEKIDITYLGPLPFLALQNRFPFAQAVATFHESDGKSGYRCVLAKFAKDPVDFTKEPRPKIALTQPFSTCGYTKTKILLKEYYHQDLSKMLYRYMGKDEDVALSVIRGDFLLAGLKESVAHEYKSLGLEIITTTAFLPGFTLVVNTKTLSPEEIGTIKKALLNAPKEIYQTWGRELSHGISEPNDALFKALSNDILDFNVPQTGNSQ